MSRKTSQVLLKIWCFLVTIRDYLFLRVSVYDNEIILRSEKHLFSFKKMNENYTLRRYQNEVNENKKFIDLTERFEREVLNKFKYNNKLKNFEFVLRNANETSLSLFGYEQTKGFYKIEKDDYCIREVIALKKQFNDSWHNDIYFVNLL